MKTAFDLQKPTLSSLKAKIANFDFRWLNKDNNDILYNTRQLIDLFNLDGWKACIDTRPKVRFGQCRYRLKEIGVSEFLIRKNDVKVVENTILHEIAHAISGVYFRSYKHSNTWRNIFMALGGNGKRCSDANSLRENQTTNCKYEAGLEDDYIGEVINVKGLKIEVTNYNKRARKNKIEGKCLETGSLYKMPETLVRSALGLPVKVEELKKKQLKAAGINSIHPYIGKRLSFDYLGLCEIIGTEPSSKYCIIISQISKGGKKTRVDIGFLRVALNK